MESGIDTQEQAPDQEVLDIIESGSERHDAISEIITNTVRRALKEENRVNYMNFQELLISHLIRFERELSRPLTYEELISHAHFGAQHLEKNPKAHLVFDEILKINYERNLEQTAQTLQTIEYFTKNIEQLAAQFKSQKNEILQALNNGSLNIITNHSTWANFPIIIAAMNKAFGDDPDFQDENFDSFLDRFITILGPALMTEAEGLNIISSLSNIIKTWPQTIRGIVSELETVMTQVTKRAIKPMLHAAKNTGNIILLCPSGTSDKVSDDGSIGIKRPTDKSLKLIKGLNKRASTLVVGTNDCEVFSDGTPKEGYEHLKISTIHSPNSITDPEAIMQELAKNIIDKQGNSIGVCLEEPA